MSTEAAGYSQGRVACGVYVYSSRRQPAGSFFVLCLAYRYINGGTGRLGGWVLRAASGDSAHGAVPKHRQPAERRRRRVGVGEFLFAACICDCD